MEDKVSVIIPVYNSEKFLSESIKSILDQSYKNIEIIAVDDGSTDNSLEILNQFKDEIIIIHQENQGLAGALNTGIEKMNGEWFKWLSADDILKPNAVKILCDEVKNLGKESYSNIFYSNYFSTQQFGFEGLLVRLVILQLYQSHRLHWQFLTAEFFLQIGYLGHHIQNLQ